MDHPVREVPGIITALTQGNSEEQAKALEDYFLPDAYFIHPFCRVPSFRDYRPAASLPFVGSWSFSSRRLVQAVYEWYRILSPKITFTVDSIVFDQRASLLYLTIRQTFTLWFVPFELWQANVKLVTVLELAQLPVDGNNRPRGYTTTIASENDTNNNANSGGGNDINDDDHGGPVGPRTRFFIKGQEDHYQIEEFLKFIAPWGAAPLWIAWQLFATLFCTLGVLLWPFGLVRAANRWRRERREWQKKTS